MSGNGRIKHLALNLPEATFALVTEQIRNRSPFTLLDQRIRIDQRDPQTPCQTPSQGALAATHVADQKETFHRQKRFSCSGSITCSASPFGRSISKATPPDSEPVRGSPASETITPAEGFSGVRS